MNKISSYPVDGKYGKYGGRFVPEVLMEAITELEKAYAEAAKTLNSKRNSIITWQSSLARPTPLYYAENLTANSAAQKSTSNAKTSHTAEHTKSTTPSAKHSSPNAWAKPASSPKPAQDNTASQQPSHVPHSDSKASCTWAPKTVNANA